MAALDVFQAISNQVDSDFLAIDVLPIVWQFSLGPLLNLPQFQAYMVLIKSMSARVEGEQTRKLQELGANSSTATTRNEFMSFGGTSATNGFDTNNEGGADFEALVRGGQPGPAGGADMIGGDPWANASASASSSTVLPSRPSNNRGRSSNNASPAATFSWSTPPVSPPSVNNTSLNAPKAQSRAITPDSTFGSLNSSFPAMAPINPGIGSPSFIPPQQQSRPTTSMNSMMSPNTAPSYGVQSTGGIDWSKASNSGTSMSAPWNATSAAPSTSSGLSSFSIAPPSSQAPSQTQSQSNTTEWGYGQPDNKFREWFEHE
jgi:SCY1-like protein 2